MNGPAVGDALERVAAVLLASTTTPEERVTVALILERATVRLFGAMLPPAKLADLVAAADIAALRVELRRPPKGPPT